MQDDSMWSGTPSGVMAYRAKLRMDDAIRRLRSETHPRRRVRIVLEYSALMGEWLHHMQEHLRLLDAAPPHVAKTAPVRQVATAP